MLSLLRCWTSDLKFRESRRGLSFALFERQRNSNPRHLPLLVTPTYYWGSKNPVQGEEEKKEYPPTPSVLLKPGCADSWSCAALQQIVRSFTMPLCLCFDIKTDMPGRILHCNRIEKKKEDFGEISTVGLLRSLRKARILQTVPI